MERQLQRLFCICVLCFFITTLQAQRNYRQGFIITLQNDTVYGQIDFRTDYMNSQRCVFLPDSTSLENTYRPFDIQGYRFMDDGKMYVSKSIRMKQNETPIHVFLEYLVKGIKSLYYLDNENTPIYFVENGDVLVKVDAPRLSKRSINFQFKGDADRYIPILNYVFSDCPKLKSEINHTKFNHNSLIELTKKYHYAMCTSNEDCVEFVTREDRHKVQLFLTPYVGLVQYMLPANKLNQGLGKPQLSYLGGVNFAISSRRWMSSMSGIIDMSLSQLKITNGVDSYSHIFLSPQVGIRYTYPKGNLRPFAGGGADFNIPIFSSSTIENKKWEKAIYSGYYAEVGMNILLCKNKKQALNIRFQLKDLRNIIEKSRFAYGWSGTLGYSFQIL